MRPGNDRGRDREKRSPGEAELLACYRRCTEEWRRCLLLNARAAACESLASARVVEMRRWKR